MTRPLCAPAIRPNINYFYLWNVFLHNRRQVSVELLIKFNSGILVNVSVSLLGAELDSVTVCRVPFLLLLNWLKRSLSSKLWSSQLRTQFKQLRIEAWKSQEFNGIWTHDLTIPVQLFNQLSHEATDIGSWSFLSSKEPVKNGCEVIYKMFKHCVHNWEDHSLLDFKSAVQDMKHFIYLCTMFIILLSGDSTQNKLGITQVFHFGMCWSFQSLLKISVWW